MKEVSTLSDKVSRNHTLPIATGQPVILLKESATQALLSTKPVLTLTCLKIMIFRSPSTLEIPPLMARLQIIALNYGLMDISLESTSITLVHRPTFLYLKVCLLAYNK